MTNKNTHKDTYFNVRPDILICFFIVIITLAVYWQVQNHGFINLDDGSYIQDNQYVRSGLTFEGIIRAFSFPGHNYWHPLTWLSHMLDCHLYGLMPGMHHKTNLILHIVNSLLLFFVFKRMTGAVWQSAFVAAVFALHPLNVESVAWLSERKNVLSTFFWMLTILTYIYYNERPGYYRYLLLSFVFALGLMSKPMLMTLPFVLLLLDYWPLGRLRLAQTGSGGSETRKSIKPGFQWSLFLRLVLEKIPFLTLSAVCIYLSSLSLQRLGIVISTESVPMKIRIANALVSYVGYIKKMIWPHNLAVYYPYPQTLPLWQVAGAGLLLLCISVLVFRAAMSKPYLPVGWLWYIGTLIPAIGLVQAGLWPSMADRFAYVPLIGLFLIIAWGVPELVNRWSYREIGLAIITVALLSILLTRTWVQTGYWANSITLFEHALYVTDDNHVAHHKLGEALIEQGKTTEGIRHYYEALKIKPDFVATHLILGVSLRGKGRLNEAIGHFSKALLIKPDFAEAHRELGITFKEQGNLAEAVRHYLEALRIEPDYAEDHNGLGIILARQGNDKEAIYHFNEALRVDSGYSDAYFNMGKIFTNQGKIEDAILYYRKALHFSPDMKQALYNLSWIIATHEDEKFRNGEEAVKLAEKLCKITQYNQPLALDALAAAYAETGKFEEAVLTAQEALKLALLHGHEGLALGLKKRFKLYLAGRPYRQQTVWEIDPIN